MIAANFGIEGPAYPNATGATWGPNLDVERAPPGTHLDVHC